MQRSTQVMRCWCRIHLAKRSQLCGASLNALHRIRDERALAASTVHYQHTKS